MGVTVLNPDNMTYKIVINGFSSLLSNFYFYFKVMRHVNEGGWGGGGGAFKNPVVSQFSCLTLENTSGFLHLYNSSTPGRMIWKEKKHFRTKRHTLTSAKLKRLLRNMSNKE